MMTREEAVDLARQVAAKRGKVESLARAGRHPEAGELACECVAMVGRLRAEVGNAMAIVQAEQVFRVVAGLTRVEAVSYLPALARALTEFARCCQQSKQFERAAGMFGSAVEAQKILLASKRVDQGRVDQGRVDQGRVDQGQTEQSEAELAVALELIELMSNHALALAQADQLAQAYEVAGEFVELARGRLPRSLPLLTGGLLFLGDLASDLGRPRDAAEHLVEGMRALGAAIGQGLPGAEEAGRRMAAPLRKAATAAEFDLPEDVALLLTKLAPA
jgi:tetratricopeptide (TPR) repeat protein